MVFSARSFSGSSRGLRTSRGVRCQCSHTMAVICTAHPPSRRSRCRRYSRSFLHPIHALHNVHVARTSACAGSSPPITLLPFIDIDAIVVPGLDHLTSLILLDGRLVILLDDYWGGLDFVRVQR
eukprot:3907096-Heterocapsa_arctica.AAC.1